MIGTQTFCVGGASATTELAVEMASDESLLVAPLDNAGKGCEAVTSTELPHGCEFSKGGNWGDDSKGKMCVTHEILSPMPRTHVKEKKKKLVCSCNPSTGEVETGRHLGLPGQPA